MKRLLADVQYEEYARVAALMDECGAATMREFIRGAIAVLRWAVEERKQGRFVGSLDDRRRAFTQYDHSLLVNVRRARASGAEPTKQSAQ